MRTMLAAMALAIAAWSGAAHAAAIGGSATVCRASPSTRATVVERLAARVPVDVVGARRGWSRVRTRAARTCWISSRLLAGSSILPVASATSRRPVATARRARHAAAGRGTRARHGLGGIGGGSCPCGGGVCVGPRGGRYCITSGGNKRYGM